MKKDNSNNEIGLIIRAVQLGIFKKQKCFYMFWELAIIVLLGKEVWQLNLKLSTFLRNRCIILLILFIYLFCVLIADKWLFCNDYDHMYSLVL